MKKLEKIGGFSQQIKPGSDKKPLNGYEPPTFECHGLSIITLGGSPGAEDSGAAGAENPLGGSSGGSSTYSNDTYSAYDDNDF